MKLVKRCSWIAAWGVWLWLGFGLYRELPRDLGPLVCRLTSNPREFPQCFVNGRPIVAVLEHDMQKDAYAWHLVDALSGARQDKVFDAPAVWNPPEFSPGLRFQHIPYILRDDQGLSSVSGVPDSVVSKSSRSGRRCIADFSTGRLLVVTGKVEGPIYHPKKPWAAFWSGSRRIDEECYIVVLDLETGSQVFVWHEKDPGESQRRLAGAPFFINEDRIAVSVQPGGPPFRLADREVEVWSVPKGDSPIEVIRGHGIAFGAAAFDIGAQRRGNGGVSAVVEDRVAWHWRQNGKEGFDVFDLREKKQILSIAADDEGPLRHRGYLVGYGAPVLSSDGGSVLSTVLYQLHDLRSLQPIWIASGNEEVSAVDEGERFEVRETWKLSIGRWKKEWVTFAVRRFKDGAVESRTWKSTLVSRCTTDDGRALTLVKNEVYGLPPRVNYPLLALCQSILALPLILFWAILRWRRSRRLRLAGVQP